MMNIKNFQKLNLKTKVYLVSSFVESKQLCKITMYRLPLFFNLYENRLIHSEFLKEIFAELLENKEILKYNFQNKIFSLYTKNTNHYIEKISLLQRTKIVLISTLIILLIRSFPYKTLCQENKNFFRFYWLTLINAIKSPFSVGLLVFYKMIRRFKIQKYFVSTILNLLFFSLVKKLFLNYVESKNFTQNLIFNYQTYANLFNPLEVLQLVRLYRFLTMFWVYMFFKQYISVSRILKRYKYKLNITY